MHQQQTAFENIVGKEEIAHNEQFLLFPQCFLVNQIIVPHLSIFFYIKFLFAGQSEKPKIGKLGKGLKINQYRFIFYLCRSLKARVITFGAKSMNDNR